TRHQRNSFESHCDNSQVSKYLHVHDFEHQSLKLRNLERDANFRIKSTGVHRCVRKHLTTKGSVNFAEAGIWLLTGKGRPLPFDRPPLPLLSFADLFIIPFKQSAAPPTPGAEDNSEKHQERRQL
ncbi:hypothetical protein K0M31_018148, partial [Melipona bicolor]